MTELPSWIRLVWYVSYFVVLISGMYGLTVRHQLFGAVMVLMSAMGLWIMAVGDTDE